MTRTRKVLFVTAAALLSALVVLAMLRTAGKPAGRARVLEPQAVMGTSCRLVAVPGDGAGETAADRALEAAERRIRNVEARMSSWIEHSEIGRLNRAPAGRVVELSTPTRQVLRRARAACQATSGAFDATLGPAIELWRAAGKRGRLPTAARVRAARAASTWELLELTEKGAVKAARSVRVDLGGVAKGYAIDEALDELEAAGLAGGLVDIGGDLAVFGQPPEGTTWRVDVRDPFGEGVLGHLRIHSGAVCTSGNYARFTTIDDARFSHILDPRTGRPVTDAVPSVTVLAPHAVDADIWSTALSVLGSERLASLPEGVQALMVLGTREAPRLVCTRGMAKLLGEDLRTRADTFD